MTWVLFSIAMAGPTDTYPRMATVDLPQSGIHRIHVPTDLHDAIRPLNERNLRLQGRDGQPVPFALLSGETQSERVTARDSREGGKQAFGAWPLGANTYRVAVRETPIETLEMRLGNNDYAVRARLYDTTTQELLQTELFWRQNGGARHGSFTMPRRRGTFEVRVEGEFDGSPTFQGVRRPADFVPAEHVPLQVDGMHLQDGHALYEMPLAHPWPIQTVRLDIEDDLFERQAGASMEDLTERPDELPYIQRPSMQTIKRMELAGTRVRQTTVPVSGDFAERLTVFVETHDANPLDVRGGTGTFPGIHLLVKDPGQGPFTLYAGGPPNPLAVDDLDFAGSELAASAGAVIEPHTLAVNPAFVPPESRGNLGRPGPKLLTRKGHRYRRDVKGTGLVRIPLDNKVIRGAMPDLRDVRLLDDEDRQIPFSIRRTGRSKSWEQLPMERTEDGQKSILTVDLPEAGAMLGSIRLTTEAPLFRRTVSIERQRPERYEVLRAFRWLNQRSPGAIDLDVYRRAGDQIRIVIDNGDNPPLPLEPISITFPVWEMIAVLPEGPVDLVYGNRSIGDPTYDIELVQPDLLRRATQDATLGEEETYQASPLTWFQRVVLGAGVGFMAIGLLALLIGLLRGTPIPEENDEDEDEDEDEDASHETEAPTGVEEPKTPETAPTSEPSPVSTPPLYEPPNAEEDDQQGDA